MGLNIVANRKMSLKGFAEGWDNCHLLIRGVNETRRQELQSQLGEKPDDKVAGDLIRSLCLEVIVGGQVITTDADGSTRMVTVAEADVPDVVEALNFAWQQEVASVATGADRLKANLM